MCDDAWKGPFTQAIFFVGAAIGTLAFGYIGDTYGRYPAFFGSTTLLCLMGILLPYCDSFWTFSAVRFLMGLTHTAYFTNIFMLGKRN